VNEFRVLQFEIGQESESFRGYLYPPFTQKRAVGALRPGVSKINTQNDSPVNV
jgi:hypothetical protein